MSMPDILEKILAVKYQEVQAALALRALPVLRALEHRLQTAEAEGSAEAQVAAAGAKP